MTFRVINADVMDGLAQLEDESVHCVVSSPPYWGLRDYGVEGQIGLEPTLGEHIAKLVAVFREVRRVLRKDGTLWLNYGDCFATSVNGRSAADTKALGNDDRTFRDKPFSTVGPIYRDKRSGKRWGGGNNSDATLKPKDLCMIPHRLAIALQEDGWWVRMDNVWAKPNPMPESITDRPTKSHEFVFLLAKAERYYYDAEAIKEMRASDERVNGSSRNRRSVWTIATAPFPEAHFATFPSELPEICIKAGCPVGGTVLDPFAGAGTTLVVADRLQRNAIGIELNPEYAAMAERRLKNDRGGLFDFIEQAPPPKQLSLLEQEA